MRQINPHAREVAPCELLPSQTPTARDMVRGQTFFPRETVQQTFKDVNGENQSVKEKELSRFLRSQPTLNYTKYLPGHPF